MCYQKDYILFSPEQLNFRERQRKALKIVAIIKDFLQKRGINDTFNLTILEIGCSAGGMTNVFAKHFKHVTAIDIDTGALKLAKKRNRHRNIVFQFADSLSLPLKKEMFDIVICNHVYEHVENAKKLMDEIYRVLKIGGACYFSGPNKYTVIEPHYFLPFLSWLPRRLASFYVRLTGRAEVYYETPLSYQKLKKITSRFSVNDYTIDVIKQPKKYFATHRWQRLFSLIPQSFFQRFLYNMPSFFWVLKKYEER